MNSIKIKKRIYIYSGLAVLSFASLVLLFTQFQGISLPGMFNKTLPLVLIATISVFLTFCCLIVDYFTIRSVQKELSRAANQIEKMAFGDLSQGVDANGWDVMQPLIGALVHLATNLQGVIGELKSSYEPISNYCQEIRSKAELLSQGAKKQESAALKVLFFVEQTTAGIIQNASNACQVEDAAEKASQDAEESRRAFQMVVDAMKQIAEKTSLIQEIARQTNLLALNINLEAVKPAEQEKGFIGVAWEVGKLAIKTKKAAAEITKQAITNIKVAQIAVEKLKQLLPVIHETEELARGMCSINDDKYVKTDEVLSARKYFDEVVLENSGAAEDMIAVTNNLKYQLTNFKDAIDFFKIDEVTLTQNYLIAPEIIFNRDEIGEN